MEKFVLPPAPCDLTGPVKAWSQAVVIPTYLPMPADKNPMFLEKRVYQGSSGRVYPLPIIDRIAENKVDHAWNAVHIENEFLRLMILPQIGGRIHVGLDKTNNYDFFYRQNVIKPALVGLAGPWISGGVEFNWPQHHRPSTFMPTDVEIERHADGSVTIWCSEHEPMNRMKGMHGVCLHPGKAIIELKARVYNRTPFVQTFLWWANVATRVHEKYQSFFPPDVHYVADHAKRAMSRFPKCDGFYYGVDYGKRGRLGVPAEEMPAQFVPDGSFPANDLAWYANIPVPTSYMAMGSNADFFGGYDHGVDAGLVHVANHHISPGKKQWTWGNQEFGYSWDRNLTDSDGPYIELMAGVYTDNQPDFSFLHPGETRTWSQFWYPIQRIGPASHATRDGAISLQLRNHRARVGIAVTSIHASPQLTITCGNQPLVNAAIALAPDHPFVGEYDLPPGKKESDLRISLLDGNQSVISYQPREQVATDVPAPASEPALPEDVESTEQLYLIGLHLDQYRHATRSPDSYWKEAIRRNPTDTRCLNALGLWHLRRGDFQDAVDHFDNCTKELTRYNPNPRDGEVFYNLGLALIYLERPDEAYDAFYKATWNYAWQSPASYALAGIDCSRGDFTQAIDHLDRSLRVNADHLQARRLKILVLRKIDDAAAADQLLTGTVLLDPADAATRLLADGTLPRDVQVALDIALDYFHWGFYDGAVALLQEISPDITSGAKPLIHYYLAYAFDKLGRPAEAADQRRRAARAPSDYCFPARLDEIRILRAAIDASPRDARARYYLANLFYDRRRHEEAIELWEEAASLDSAFPTSLRNLGIACFNIRHDANAALDAYEKACAIDGKDARLLYERDQLWKRLGKAPLDRLGQLERHPQLVEQRDDLSIELCTLYNQTGQPERALGMLQTRHFQPWEGGEGLALEQHVRTHLLLGHRSLADGNAQAALEFYSTALTSPKNLGEAKHLLANQSNVHYFLGRAHQALGDLPAAQRHFAMAAQFRGDFQQMAVRSFSEMTYYSALALRSLDRHAEADALLADLLTYARDLEHQPARIDYFATSLPTLLLFDGDLQQRQSVLARFLQAQALLAMDNASQARQLLNRLLAEDPNDATALDLLGSMDDPALPRRSFSDSAAD